MFSLFAREERDAKRQTLNDPLALLALHVDFAAIAAVVDAKLTLGPSSRGGRPPYPTVVMVKLLLLQQLYNLSDDALEYQVLDRISFLRFLGLEGSRRAQQRRNHCIAMPGTISISPMVTGGTICSMHHVSARAISPN